MKSLILYDSLYGNTKKIAESIADTLSFSGKTILLSINETNQADLEHVELLIVGSPTHGGRPTPGLLSFLKDLEEKKLKGIRVAAFDTRFLEADLNFALRILVKTIGYASPKIIEQLILCGGEQATPPEGFIVKGERGPLAQGEIERVKNWAKQLSQQNEY